MLLRRTSFTPVWALPWNVPALVLWRLLRLGHILNHCRFHYKQTYPCSISYYIKGFNALINTLVVESKPRPSLTAHRVHYFFCRISTLDWIFALPLTLAPLERSTKSTKRLALHKINLLNATKADFSWSDQSIYLFVLTTVLILLGE